MSRRMTGTLDPMRLDAAVAEWTGMPRAGQDVPEIVFGVQGDPDDGRAIRALPSFCSGVDHGNARLCIVHVVTVPMTLPLDAELPDADATALGILGRATLAAGIRRLPGVDRDGAGPERRRRADRGRSAVLGARYRSPAAPP